jgi:hypothetical protein
MNEGLPGDAGRAPPFAPFGHSREFALPVRPAGSERLKALTIL